MKNYDPTRDKKRPAQSQAFARLMQISHKLQPNELEFLRGLRPKFEHGSRITTFEEKYLATLINTYIHD